MRSRPQTIRIIGHASGRRRICLRLSWRNSDRQACRPVFPKVFLSIAFPRYGGRTGENRMPSVMSNLSDDLKNQALAYHRFPKPGKLEIAATKPLGTQHDLALAYSPGVAAACEAIAADPREAAEL